MDRTLSRALRCVGLSPQTCIEEQYTGSNNHPPERGRAPSSNGRGSDPMDTGWWSGRRLARTAETCRVLTHITKIEMKGNKKDEKQERAHIATRLGHPSCRAVLQKYSITHPKKSSRKMAGNSEHGSPGEARAAWESGTVCIITARRSVPSMAKPRSIRR